MANKTRAELEKMSRCEMAHFIIEITQTPICRNKKYCNMVLEIWLKK
jgi:hypothetical protein